MEHVGKQRTQCLTSESNATAAAPSASSAKQAAAAVSTSTNHAVAQLKQQKQQLKQQQTHKQFNSLAADERKNGFNGVGSATTTDTHSSANSLSRPSVVMRKLKINNGTHQHHQESLKTTNQSLTNDSANPASPVSPTSLSSTSPTSPSGVGSDPSSAELRQLKRDCDPQYSRFADYFVICGLDLDTGLEPDRFAGKALWF